MTTISLEDAKVLAATLGSVIVACGSFFLYLTKLVIHQAIADADKDLHSRIDGLRTYVDNKLDEYVTTQTLDQLSKRVDDLHG